MKLKMPPKPSFCKSTLSVDRTHVNLDNNLEVVRVLTSAIVELFARHNIRSKYDPRVPALAFGWSSVLAAGVFIGIPTVLKVPLETRRISIVVGLLLFWSLYLIHKVLEAKDNTIFVLTDAKGRTVRISGRLCPRTGLYTVKHKENLLLEKSIGEYYNVDGDLVGENVERDFEPLCQVVQDMLTSKTE